MSNLEIAHWWNRCNRFSRIILQLATKRNVCLNGMACKKKGGAGMRCVVINHYTDLLGVFRVGSSCCSFLFLVRRRRFCSYCEAQDIVTTSRGRCDKSERQSDCASPLAYKEVLMRWISVIKRSLLLRQLANGFAFIFCKSIACAFCRLCFWLLVR